MSRVFATAAVIAIAAIGGIAYMATRPVGPDVGSTPSPSAIESATPSPVMQAFHNNGPIVIEDRGLRAIDPMTGEEVAGLHLPDRQAASGATWSPDGMQLAYTRPDGLWVMDVSTGDSRMIADCGPGFLDACSIAWSPDGSLIAVARPRSPLELIDRQTGEVTRLETPAGTVEPTWSPDGRRIAFMAIDGYGTDVQHPRLYVINRDGSGLSLLLDADTGDPSWSADGSTIAYLGSTPVQIDGEEQYELRVMLLELDSSETRELVEVGTCFCIGFAPGLTWSPDGAMLALSVPGFSGEYGLHIVNSDGTGLHRVSSGAGTPAWRPEP